MWFRPIFQFLTLGGVFLGVKNNSKNYKNKKNIRLFGKILSKRTLFYSVQCLFTQNFAKQLNIFPPKFLELFFTPKNTLPKVKISKMGLNRIFLGHPVY